MKRLIFWLLGKDPEAVVVSFWTGEDALALRMIREIQELIPDRQHYVVTVGPAPEVPNSIRIELQPGDAPSAAAAAWCSPSMGMTW